MSIQDIIEAAITRQEKMSDPRANGALAALTDALRKE